MFSIHFCTLKPYKKFLIYTFSHIYINPLFTFPVFTDVEALMDEAKSMNTVGKYNENIVNLQGVCFDWSDGCNLRNVCILCNYFLIKINKTFLKIFAKFVLFNEKKSIATSLNTFCSALKL